MSIQEIPGKVKPPGINGDLKSGRRERPLLLPCFYFIEVPLFGIAAVLTYILHFTNVFSVLPVVFDPQDVTLAQPYLPEQNRILSKLTLFLVISASPCIIITGIEFILFITLFCCKFSTEPAIGSTGCYISSTLRRVVRFVGMYLFGLMISSIICDVVQNNLPALSPYFLSLCVAEKEEDFIVARENKNMAVPEKSERYRSPELFLSNNCLPRLGAAELLDARREFPSYFVFLASYAATYVALYLRMIAIDAGPVVKSAIAWVCISFPYVVGLLEIAENTSYITSVLTGCVFGIAVAAYLTNEIFFPSIDARRCFCTRARNASPKSPENEASNVFETAPASKFPIRHFKVEEEDRVSVSNRNEDGNLLRPQSRVGSKITVDVASPSPSRFSRCAADISDEDHRGHTMERNVIRELQNYMTETDFRKGSDSPKPTQIRELSKGATRNRQLVLSTFMPHPDEDEECNELSMTQNIPDDLHAAGSVSDTSAYGLPINFQKSSSYVVRPSSFSSDNNSLSESSDVSSSANSNPILPETAFSDRHTSYRDVTRLHRSQFGPRPVTMDGSMMGTFTEPSFTEKHSSSAYPRIYYSSENEEDPNSRKASSVTSPLVPQQPTLSPKSGSERANETSNLLQEVISVMEDKQIESDDENSDDTITGEPPSIAV